MASPPFNINQALPGDTDIVSQHPGNARTFRDVVESWLLVNHDTSGNHARVDMPQIASPSNPAAGIDVLYVTTTKRLKIKHSDGTEEYVGIPPGVIIFGSGALDTGYLEADGSAVSRATFADLFTKIGTTYGAGDGSTTFNLPDVKGRVLVGIDAAGVRLTATGLGTAAVLGAVGGLETMLIGITNLPAHDHAVFLKDPGHFHTYQKAGGSPVGGGGAFGFDTSLTGSVNTSTVFTNMTIGSVSGTANDNKTATTGSGTTTKNVQPTIVQRAMIKY